MNIKTGCSICFHYLSAVFVQDLDKEVVQYPDWDIIHTSSRCVRCQRHLHQVRKSLQSCSNSQWVGVVEFRGGRDGRWYVWSVFKARHLSTSEGGAMLKSLLPTSTSALLSYHSHSQHCWKTCLYQAQAARCTVFVWLLVMFTSDFNVSELDPTNQTLHQYE